MELSYTVDEQSNGKTVKYILKSKLKISERLIKKLKYAGKITCNSTPVYVSATIGTGDIIEVSIDFIESYDDVIPQNIHLDIVYEDDSIIVLNKQPNIVVHPTSSHPDGTIANGIVFYLLKKGVIRKVRPVSRLDRDTSGIIIFAKNQYVQEHLIQQMKSNSFKKEYLGIVHGIIKYSCGTINLPIERKPGSIMLRQVSPTGTNAVTHYMVQEYFNNATLLKFLLETGRTHQIRVHCQAVGHPLIGDSLYPSETADDHPPIIGRQALHSYKVEFIHPLSGKQMVLSTPLPQDILNAMEILKK